MPALGTSLAARASRRMHAMTNQIRAAFAPQNLIQQAAATTSSSSGRGLGRLVPSETALLVCDLQERFRPIIAGMPAVIETARRMIRGAAALELPVIVTEQYPKALGSTVKELADILPEGALTQDKLHFSMMVDPVKERLKGLSSVRKILLLGIETHVCVFQTAVDLLEEGYEVHLVVDGVSSQRHSDRAVAIERISQMGAMLVSSEMALFQLCGSAKVTTSCGAFDSKLMMPASLPPVSRRFDSSDWNLAQSNFQALLIVQHPAFKAISGLAKEERPDFPHQAYQY